MKNNMNSWVMDNSQGSLRSKNSSMLYQSHYSFNKFYRTPTELFSNPWSLYILLGIYDIECPTSYPSNKPNWQTMKNITSQSFDWDSRSCIFIQLLDAEVLISLITKYDAQHKINWLVSIFDTHFLYSI